MCHWHKWVPWPLPHRCPAVLKCIDQVRRVWFSAWGIISYTIIRLQYMIVKKILKPNRPGHSLPQVVLMGGAMGVGNRHPVGEFNILCDPEAAKIVFQSDLKVG